MIPQMVQELSFVDKHTQTPTHKQNYRKQCDIHYTVAAKMFLDVTFN